MDALSYAVLIGLPLIGGAAVLFLPAISNRHMRMLLTFSGAYLFGVTILHLLPIAFQHPTVYTGLFILAGFLIQLLLDMLSQGVEHGHVHHHEHMGRNVTIGIMIGLCLHAFMEGIPLGGIDILVHDGHEHLMSTSSPVPLLLGISLHKVPAAFALMAMLSAGSMKKWTLWLCLGIFALMSPLAAGLTEWLNAEAAFDLTQKLPYVLALVTGSFMHISTTILFEIGTPEHHTFRWTRWVSILVGLGLAVLTIVV